MPKPAEEHHTDQPRKWNSRAELPTRGGSSAPIPTTANNRNLAVWCAEACGGTPYRLAKEVDQSSRITDQREAVLPLYLQQPVNKIGWYGVTELAEEQDTIPPGMSDRREEMLFVELAVSKEFPE